MMVSGELLFLYLSETYSFKLKRMALKTPSCKYLMVWNGQFANCTIITSSLIFSLQCKDNLYFKMVQEETLFQLQFFSIISISYYQPGPCWMSSCNPHEHHKLPHFHFQSHTVNLHWLTSLSLLVVHHPTGKYSKEQQNIIFNHVGLVPCKMVIKCFVLVYLSISIVPLY